MDESLRGEARNFDTKGEDLTPELLKFGKYNGRFVADIAKEDFGYILWLVENSYSKTREVCKLLPEYIEYVSKLESDRLAKIERYKPLVSGVQSLLFINNPRYSECGHNANDYGAEMYYIECIVDEAINHRIYVIISPNDIKHIDGMYPYNMLYINGKAKKTKNKEFSFNLEITHTDTNEYGCYQFAQITQ